MEFNQKQCIACGVCEDNCPLSAVSLQNQETLLELRIPPCSDACPVKTNVPMYISRIKEKDYEGAYYYISERNPFPSICGRVCHHPCESACRRGEFDEPLAIRELKRFASDKFVLKTSIPENNKAAVAIIGAGPAGLTAAWSLIQMGYQPTVFEKEKMAGGWMRYGIPDYRLPKEVLDKEINAILSLGVKIKYGALIGKKITLDSLRKAGFKAILVAVGSQESQRVNIPGAELKGILQGLNLLQAYNSGRHPKVRGKVAVIGGGNVAIDSARVALRLGASRVTILYRRTIEQMPAAKEEIRETQAEGIEIKYLADPIEFKGSKGKVTEIVCQNMVLGGPDETGRARPIPAIGSTFSLAANLVVCAIGQKTDIGFLESSASAMGRALRFDRKTLESGLPGLFVAGDMVTGPATVIEAIASGLRAALCLSQYLKGEDVTGEIIPTFTHEAKAPYGLHDYPSVAKRIQPRLVPVRLRKGNFDEVNTGYHGNMALKEADRCWHCDMINDFPLFSEKCVQCNLCSRICPTKAIPMGQEIIEGAVRCDSCPIKCQIKVGFKGACQRYINIDGELVRDIPLQTYENVKEIVGPNHETAIQKPLITAIGAGTTYPDPKPAPFIVQSRVEGIDVVTVVTEAPLSYSGIKVKIDTDKNIGEETAPILIGNRQIGHLCTEEYGSKILSIGGANLLTGPNGPTVARLTVDIANRKEINVKIGKGADLVLQVGKPPIIDGEVGARMRVGCGSASMGLFARHYLMAAEEVIVLDAHLIGQLTEHVAGTDLGAKYSGILLRARRSTPGRYFGEHGQGWGGTNIMNPIDIIAGFDSKIAKPGMTVLITETTAERAAMFRLDNGKFVPIELTPKAKEVINLMADTCEISRVSAFFSGGSGGSARAGVAKAPVKLTQAIHQNRAKMTVGGAPVFVLPGGGITFLVDVEKVMVRGFSWVPTPAVVVPIEYTMRLDEYLDMAGHKESIRKLEDVLWEIKGKG
jgi:NADPH-dependent glutamate synthase beta subunit-like oxidoreductase